MIHACVHYMYTNHTSSMTHACVYYMYILSLSRPPPLWTTHWFQQLMFHGSTSSCIYKISTFGPTDWPVLPPNKMHQTIQSNFKQDLSLKTPQISHINSTIHTSINTAHNCGMHVSDHILSQPTTLHQSYTAIEQVSHSRTLQCMNLIQQLELMNPRANTHKCHKRSNR